MDLNVRREQLYHLLNSQEFTYCLICMEDFSRKSNLESEESHVKVHLNSSNHQENIKFLFKLCNPDPVNECETEMYLDTMTELSVDIMQKSVFDISNILGKDTCYICCQNKDLWVCLLCHEKVSDTDLTNKKIKKRIVKHLLSDNHMKSVKSTTWIYHFNSYKYFIRFHKTLLYCSACNESFRFEESEFLRFADYHLKVFHCVSGDKSEATRCNDNLCKSEEFSSTNAVIATQDKPGTNDESTTSTCEEEISVQNNCSENFQIIESDVSQPNETSLPPENLKRKCYTCHLCLGDIELSTSSVARSIDYHCRIHHQKDYDRHGSSLVKDVICFNRRFLSQKVINKKYPGIKVLASCVPVFGENSKYIQIFNTVCFCSLCRIMISFDPDPNGLLRKFSEHFHSVEHKKSLKKFDKLFGKKPKDSKKPQDSQKTKNNSKDT